ncbi:MAG: tyrosine-type recombinase/integrase [Planctomycetes bacterium]|nr:tyrosine-type recombinase/integrase [Planctomycetota bacterium]
MKPKRLAEKAVERPGRGGWYIRIYDPVKRTNTWSCRFATKFEAEAWSRAERRRLARGIEEDPAVTFRQAAEAFLAERETRRVVHATLRSYRGFAKQLVEAFGDKPLGSISAEDLDRHFAGRAATGVTSRTLNYELTVLRSIFRLAVERQWIGRNPAASIRRWKQTKPQPRALTREELDRIVYACDEPWVAKVTGLRNVGGRRGGATAEEPSSWTQKHRPPKWLRPYVIVAVNTGLRRGTMLALKWTEVNLKRAEIRIPAEKLKAGRGMTIPLNRDAIEALSAWRHDAGVTELVFPEAGNVSKLFHRVAKRTGVEVRLHDLRSTFASRLFSEAGADLATAMSLTGHTTAQILLRHYAAADDKRRREAVERIARQEGS